MKPILSVYAKEGEIKIIQNPDINNIHAALLMEGWGYCSAIDPCVFLKYLYDNPDDALQELRELYKVKF